MRRVGQPTDSGCAACKLVFVNAPLPLDAPETCYTLLGVRRDGVASVVDLVAADDVFMARRRAQALLAEHLSCIVVEVWRDGAMVDRLAR